MTFESCATPLGWWRRGYDLDLIVRQGYKFHVSVFMPKSCPIPVPWLVATLRVGISDSAGMVTFEPDGFCPGKPVVAEVTVENQGCSASKATTTEVTLEDAR